MILVVTVSIQGCGFVSQFAMCLAKIVNINRAEVTAREFLK
jgi:hypothetical protein